VCVASYVRVTAERGVTQTHIRQDAKSAAIWAAGQEVQKQAREREMSRPMERRALTSAAAIAKVFPDKTFELRILQLYIWSLFGKMFVDGCRTASVARYGSYEVRLVELKQASKGDVIPFWIELFDHKSGTMIDSCGSYDFEETAVGAEALISQAKLLHRDLVGV
jgi:hypothetical protein